MADNKAKYEISLVDKYSNKLDKINKNTRSFDSTMLGLGKTLGGVFAAGVVVKGMTQLAATSLKLAGGMEQTEIAFNTFLGSAEKGRQVLENLNEFANRTPYTNDQIIKTGRALLAANIPAEELTSTLGTIGDIAAGANVPITDLGSIYAKVMNKGKLQAEELNQLAERGIPIIDQLAKEFGVTKQEVFELGSKGKITSDVMVKSFKSMTKEGGKFFKLMEKQSASAVGLLSTLEGKTEMLGVNIGKKLLPAQKKLTKQTISLVDKMNDLVKVPVSQELSVQNREYNALILSLRDTNKTEAEREVILKRLHEINPKTNELIKKEGDQLIINEDALRAYNKQQINNIILKKEEEKIAKVAKKQQDLQVQQREEELELSKDLGALSKIVNRNNKISNKDKAEFNDLLSAEGSLIDKANKARDLGRRLSNKSGGPSWDFVKRLTITKMLASTTKKLNDVDKDRNDLLAKRDQLSKDLGIDLSKTAPASVVTGKIQGAEDVTAGITKITSAAPKVFNINIGNLVENFEVSTTNLTEGEGEVRDLVTRALLEGLSDVQPLAR